MTSERCKDLLPAPHSVFLFSKPRTTTEWQSYLSQIQYLFLKGRHKQSLLLSQRLLVDTEPRERPQIYSLFLNFYAAVSNEALATAAHPFSSARLRGLEQARGFFQAAADALPSKAVPIVIEGADCFGEHADSDFEAAESERTERDGLERDTASSSTYSASTLQSDGYIANTLFPKPPSSAASPTSTTFSDAPLSPRERLISPPSDVCLNTEEPAATDGNGSFQARQESLVYTNVWIRNRSVMLYNVHLADFENLLSRHTKSTTSLLDATMDLQAARHTSRRLTAYEDDHEAKAADLRERIQRLKAAGWSRDRFDPRRYQDICEQALADL